MNEVQQTLTKSILDLKTQFDQWGKTSLPIVVECGRRLNQLHTTFIHGEWEKWCIQYKDSISITTIKRWIRVYNRSLVTDMTQMALMEAYELCGISNGSQKKKEQKPVENIRTEPEPFPKCHQLFCQFLYSFNNSTETEKALVMKVVNEWLVSLQVKEAA